MEDTEDDSIKMLRKRYASGKITKAKYQSMLKELKKEHKPVEKQKTFYWTYFIGAYIISYFIGVLISLFSSYFATVSALLIYLIGIAIYLLIVLWYLDNALVNKNMKNKSLGMGLLGWVLAIPAEWILSRKGSPDVNFIVAYILCIIVTITEAVIIASL